ncbi:MAG: alpha,alpha-phosphotrehalase [Peptoniphilaceae bacterium]|nr:alpha,alpha-phosphotrehalase [Peptoniphilaceae bacterium]MDD7383241.1 alpha,alpha-phosphotrehalase [Peptoniphilaceae bacterium]MDY3737613.1 alpha,alpha-phosphotrehalase [Peptoniphilaceae bacterium]
MSFKDKVIYQIYPKSFKDTNSDGIGDLKGITEKAEYLKSLGVDLIWISPFFKSPQNDNGYDISDYYSIEPMYGTMEDVENMIKTFKDYGIGLMFDMVFNHTSIEHEWFKKALNGEKKYRDYYYIRKPKPDGSLPNNWKSKFGGDAWAKFGNTGEYYLCLYDKTQADLNWHNENLRKELYKIINFWIDKGVEGFRFDVLNVIGKSNDLKDSDGNIEHEKKLYTDTEIVHEYIKEMNKLTFGRNKKIITVGEMSSTDLNNSSKYASLNGDELSMVFSFHHLKTDYENGNKWTDSDFDFLELKKIINKWQVGLEKENAWNSAFWNNHDQPRANSRFLNPKKYPFESSTLLATTIHMMRSTPYIYQGEEFGMTNPNFKSIEQYKDVESINAYNDLKNKGVNEEKIIKILSEKSRDNSRTPMQRDDSEFSGFSDVKPWIDFCDNYKEVNLKKDLFNEKSIFRYYQKLIKLRKNEKIISDGSYIPILEDDENIFAFLRKYKNEYLICINNFREKKAEVLLDDILENVKEFKYLIGNGKNKVLTKKMIFYPFESEVFKFYI